MREIKVRSRNIGAAQSCCDSPGPFADNNLISLILTLPRKIARSESVQVRATGRSEDLHYAAKAGG
jgi:hypothetical protein